ncbi:MAG: hypothetical protein QM726_02710 [Chitinophagaceae bacterium]
MSNNWLQFFGRFHPLLVHLPIGFLLFAALLSIIAVYKKTNFLSATINIALLAGAIAAVCTCISGLMLSSCGGYNAASLALHKWIGISVAIISFLIWLARRKNIGNKIMLKLSVSDWMLLFCIVLLAIGAHFGGNLTHGEGYLSKYMPLGLKNLFGIKKKAEEKKALPALDSVVVYRDIIQPMLDSKCISCHNPNKTNGDLDLTTIESIMKGGKSGNTIVAGNTEKSELFHRITLPVQSAKFMPADNFPALTPVEIHFMRWWIENGAVPKKNISALGVDDKTKFLVAAYLGIDAESNKDIVLPMATAADSATILQLNDMKLVLRPLTSSTNLLDASFVMLQNAPPEKILAVLQKLSGIKAQVYNLDVSNCKLNNDMIKAIAGFSRLNKIELQKNNLTDDAIAPLAALQQLTILNAGQNNLTDKSINTFKQMAALKKINLWQTQVSAEGCKALPAGVVIEGVK